MEVMDTSISIVAWWGAALSTALGLLKCYEIWRDRFRLEVSGSFTVEPRIGNEIFVRNLSGRGAIITYWEVFYSKGRWPWQNRTITCDPDPFACDSKLDAYSSVILIFRDQDHFTWAQSFLGRRKIYIRIVLAGHKISRCYCIYPR